MTSCTPLGCLMLLKDQLGDLSGLDAIVIGRSGRSNRTRTLAGFTLSGSESSTHQSAGKACASISG